MSQRLRRTPPRAPHYGTEFAPGELKTRPAAYHRPARSPTTEWNSRFKAVTLSLSKGLRSFTPSAHRKYLRRLSVLAERRSRTAVPKENQSRTWAPIGRRGASPIIEGLKARGWTLEPLSSRCETRRRPYNLEYAPLAESDGAPRFRSEIFNCNAPDTGNMEVLYHFGNDAQKKLVKPLLAGEIRSVFS